MPPGEGPIGECFELSADPDDDESARYPSIVETPHGRKVLLDLIATDADAILGPAHLARYGPRVPLLPKLLDIGAMLSVQAHPPGRPELYIVLDADPGATLRVGFAQKLDPAALQARLADAIAAGGDPGETNRWLLEQLTVIGVAAGDVIDNRSAAGDAEVHCLGDPQGRAVLAFEVRLSGPTYRAWDHGRVPARALHLDDAIAAMSFAPRTAESLRVHPRFDDERAVLADHDGFRAELFRPTREHALRAGFSSVHALAGTVEVATAAGSLILARGQSAVLPFAAVAPVVRPAPLGEDAPGQLLQLTLPT